MSTTKTLLRVLSVLVLGFAQDRSAGQATTSRPDPGGPSMSPTPANADIRTDAEAARPFTREEKTQLATKVLATPSTAQRAVPRRRKVLSITAPADTEDLPRKKGRRRIARVVVFDYAIGKAAELLVDASSAEVLAEKQIRGRPQASEEEKQEAIKVIRGDPELGRLLQANAIVEGGFIVDGPRNAPSKHRFLQIQLLSPDRLHLQRTVTVDLTAGTIAVSKAGD